MEDREYLVRYGLNSDVGRFAAEPDALYERGRTVVLRSHRGIELGEVLAESATHSPREGGAAFVLRAAGPDDLERARRVGQERHARFVACEQVFRDGVWPIDLIDAEPLLDEGRTVLYYLGPHRLDVAGLLAAMRSTCGLDVMLQPIGRDVEPEEEAPAEDDHGCGSCGSSGGGCGEGGGCGTGGGCSSCGVKALMTARR